MLEEVIVRHAAVVAAARQRLDSLETDSPLESISITGRAKTTQTIIEKVRRNKTRLSSMEDLAGVRLVARMTLRQQDDLTERVSQMFVHEGPVRIIDRRVDPRAGYRAVHVIARLDGIGLEIQVRTTVQDVWANIFEKVADRVGREIRYGLPLNLPAAMDPVKVGDVVDGLIRMSDTGYELEKAYTKAVELGATDLPNLEHPFRLLLDAVTGDGS